MVVGEMALETDLAVVGGGRSGIAAALHARAHGLECIVIDEGESPGGRADIARDLIGVVLDLRGAVDRLAAAMTPVPTIDPARVRDLLRREEEALRERAASLLEESGITFITGRASLEDRKTLRIEGNPAVPRVRFRRLVLAGGAGGENERGSDALAALLEDGSGAVHVRGGGAEGVELALALGVLGREVTLDPASWQKEIPRALHGAVQRRLNEEGITRDPGTPQTPCVVLGGRAGAVAGGSSALLVREDGSTDQPRIFVTGRALPASLPASIRPIHARGVVDRMRGRAAKPLDPRGVLSAVRGREAIAWCGLPLEWFIAEGQEATEIPASIALPGGTREPITLTCARDGSVVRGAHAAGRHAIAAIAAAALGIEMGAVAEDLTHRSC